jgi:2,6-dihydroxypyridine 3-monooxygenase
MPGRAAGHLRQAINWPRVAIVGGSLGGLTAGLVLSDLGCDVQVFERSSAALEGRGAGILVLDDTVRYLVEHDGSGGTDVIGTVCSRTDWVRYLHPDGTTRYEERRPYRFSSWNTMYRALMKCFQPDRYHLGKEVADFDQEANSVRLRFTDGTTSDCDLLVCADGIDSSSRQRLLPEVRPHYAGYVAWRGTVPERELSTATFERLRDAITYQVLPNSHILVYPIPSLDGGVEPGRRLMNFVWYRNVAEGTELDTLMVDRQGRRRAVSIPPGPVQVHFAEELRAVAAATLAPPIAEVVAHRRVEPFIQVIFDLAVPTMAFGRACLIGDAAFALRPHAAAGTAKAARDGWALAEMLAAAQGNVEQALRRWEPGQLALGRQVMLRAREIGNKSQLEGTWVPGDPALAFGLYGPSR